MTTENDRYRSYNALSVISRSAHKVTSRSVKMGTWTNALKRCLLRIRISVLFFRMWAQTSFLKLWKWIIRIKIDLGIKKTDLLNGCMVIKKKVVLPLNHPMLIVKVWTYIVKKYVPLKKTMMNNDLPAVFKAFRKLLYFLKNNPHADVNSDGSAQLDFSSLMKEQ